MYGGELRYTFVVVREDIPPILHDDDPGPARDWSIHSLHEREQFAEASELDWNGNRPFEAGPGFGVPYIGQCVQIEDRTGHWVEIEYAGSRTVAVGDARDPENQDPEQCSTGTSIDDAETTPCIEYAESVLTKGQIKYIKLRDAEGAVAWTLFYTYRGSKLPDYLDKVCWANLPAEVIGQIVLDRIYVFEGDVPALTELSPNPNLCEDAFYFEGTPESPSSSWNEANHALAVFNADYPSDALPTNWKYQVRYHYLPADPGHASGPGSAPLYPLRLAKTSVRHADAIESVRECIFEYDYDNLHQGGAGEPVGMGWLSAVYREDDLSRIEAIARDTLNTQNNHLIGVTRDALASGAITDENMGEDTLNALHDEAWFWMMPKSEDWTEYSGVEYPNPALMTAPNPVGPEYVSRNWQKLAGDNAQTVGQLSLRKEDGTVEYYQVHRLVQTPFDVTTSSTSFRLASPEPGRYGSDDSPTDVDVATAAFGAMPSAFVSPYWWHALPMSKLNDADTQEQLLAGSVVMTEPRWITVLDAFPDRHAVLSEYYKDSSGSDAAVKPRQRSRRVVEMNAGGFVLRDRRWEFGDSGTTYEGAGLGEEFVYKPAAEYFGSNLLSAEASKELLLVEKRSVGWSAVPSSEQAQKGLIEFYDYGLVGPPGTTDWSAKIRTIAEGVKRGTDGAKDYRSQVLYAYDETLRKESSCEIKFFSPPPALLSSIPSVAAGPSASYAASYALTWYKDSPSDKAWYERAATSRQQIRPPVRQRPGGDWYYPVEREFYDDDGNPKWSASGLVLDTESPCNGQNDALESLTLTCFIHAPESEDAQRRLKFTVGDAVPGLAFQTLQGHSVAVPDDSEMLGTWRRIPDTSVLPSVARRSTIEYIYKDPYGLSDTLYPNGRRWARRIIVVQNVEPKFAREFIFNDLEKGLQGQWVSRSPGEINDYANEFPCGAPSVKRKVLYSENYELNADGPFLAPSEGTDYELPWQVTLAPDQWGRLHDATLLERNASGQMVAVGTKNVNDFVDVYREREMDGTITRTVKNLLGRPMRVYIGTNDDGWAYGAGGVGPEFNMVLTQRHEWGGGPSDAWLPTIVRRYRSNPSWYEDFYGPGPSGPDDDGYATVTLYDWRMRAVRVDSYDKGDPANSAVRLSTTLTYLDHADRTRFAVTFGSDALPDLSQLAPETIDSLESANITAEVLVGLNPRPTSVVEMFYGPDGSMVERRTYDMGWSGTGDPPYQAERHCFGRGGVEVFTQMPGAAVAIKTLDALGRVASVASIAPRQNDTGYTFEITRTDNAYDGDGNVAESVRWDRVDLQSTTAALSTANAVATKTVTWYDPQKRVVAAAELGTQATSYTNPSSGGYTIFDSNGDVVEGPRIEVSNGLATAVIPSGFPSYARANLSYYDPVNGSRVYSADPSGAITKYEYNRLGSIAKRIENPTATDTSNRVTEYSYALGRLATMKTYAKSGNSQLSQVTEVQYGAEVMAETAPGEYSVVSQNNGLIRSMQLPGSDGSPALSSHVYLRYDFEGRVVERHDARRVVFRYRYDALGRLASITVGRYESVTNPGDPNTTISVFFPGYSADMSQASDPPADRIGYIEFAYDSAGDLYQTIAKELPTSSSVIATDQYERDTRRNISAEYQGLGLAAIDSDTPKIQYAWTHTNTGSGLGDVGQTRLASMTYPVHPLTNASARTLTFTYGSSHSLEDTLSRLTQVTTNIGTSSVAQLAYTGGGLRTKTTLGATKIVQDYKLGTEVGFAGIDSFGRPGDLHYKNTATTPTTLFRAKYTYDHLGQRLSAEITQIAAGSGSGQTGANKRSQLLGYDALGRLNTTKIGAIVDNNGTLSIPSPVRTDTWYLDELGNWNQHGPGDEKGRYSTGNLDAYGTAFSAAGADSGDEVGSLLLATDRRNRITEATSAFDSGTPVSTSFTYDKHGNLEFDGTYYYQYDAWSRLVQINKATLSNNPPGEPYLDVEVMVKHFTYDGLGRLVRTQSPYPDPDTSEGRVFSERYYYDGVRRIQEVATTPLASSGMAMSQGGELGQILSQTNGSSATQTDGESSPVAFEQGQVAAALSGGLETGIAVGVAREYVWGPGDRGIDELLIQYDKNRKAWYALQDAGGDIVALCDVPTSGTARVAGQWTYDAYGSVIFAEHLVAHAPLHCGHKAAFVERLDVGVYSSSSSENHRLIPFAHSISHMRNRVYAPGIGRFLQPDPNATAAVLLEASSYHGRGIGATLAAFSMEDMYGDGMNLYEYLGSNPVNRSDPMGLSWDPFDAVDDYLAESSGSTAAFMERITGGMQVAAYVGAVVASMLPFPITSIAADLGASYLENGGGIPPQLVAARKLLGYANLAVIGAFVGKMAYSATKTAIKYLMTHGLRGTVKNLIAAGKGFASKAWNWLKRKEHVPGGCGCFVAGTLVWTAVGLVPISEIRVGDEVFAEDEVTCEIDLRVVTKAIVVDHAALLRINVRDSDGQIESIETTDEHPFMVDGAGWRRADEIQPGDLLRTMHGLVSVEFIAYDSRQAQVYNLTVEGLPNYHVGNDGVLVHNCGVHWHHFLPKKFRREFNAMGITNLEKYAAYVDDSWHIAIHDGRNSAGRFTGGSWNQAWQSFWDAYPNPTPGNPSVQRVEDYLETLKALFDTSSHTVP
ncbi:MAG: polymorphic toxin-type HINT domain-containing protein [Phycisphaerales bacterium]